MTTEVPVGLVIFDCDGVLVDSEPIAARVLAECAREIGLMLTPEYCLDRFTGFSMERVVAEMTAMLGRPLPADFRTRVRDRDHRAFRDELRAIEGIHAILDDLTIPSCVASSGALEKIRLTLGLTNLLDAFDPHIFSAEMVARGKPAPDLFCLAAHSLGVPAAACVVVEDSLAGIAAARAAGMRALGFAGGGHCGPQHAAMLAAAGAENVFSRMVELPGLLKPRIGLSSPREQS